MPGRSAVLGLLALGCLAAGWRGEGGDGVFAADPPVHWSPAEGVAWFAALPSWGNATPALFGDRVCVTAEPTGLYCFDAVSGRLAWSAEHPVVDALPPEQAAPLRAEILAEPQLADALVRARETLSRLRRELRRSQGDPAITQALTEASAELASLERRLEAIRPYTTPPDQDVVGYATATPVTDGSSLYAVYGNGVVTAHAADGAVRWSRWLGRARDDILGYGVGHATSPLLVDGVLVVGLNTLVGLDPATGETRWEAGDWRHYGTAGVARVDGRGILLLPDGRMLEARTGREVGRMGDLVHYVAPVAVGDRAWVIGGFSEHDNDLAGGVLATAWRLEARGADVEATVLWQERIPAAPRVFSSLAVVGGRLVGANEGGRLWMLDADSGALLADRDIVERGPSVWSSPVITGDRVYLPTGTDRIAVMKLAEGLPLVASNALETMRGMPLPVGKRLYVRTSGGLWALE